MAEEQNNMANTGEPKPPQTQQPKKSKTTLWIALSCGCAVLFAFLIIIAGFLIFYVFDEEIKVFDDDVFSFEYPVDWTRADQGTINGISMGLAGRDYGYLAFADGVMSEDEEHALIVMRNEENEDTMRMTHKIFLQMEKRFEQFCEEQDYDLLHFEEIKISNIPTIKAAYLDPNMKGYEQTYYVYPGTPGKQYVIRFRTKNSDIEETQPIINRLIGSMEIIESSSGSEEKEEKASFSQNIFSFEYPAHWVKADNKAIGAATQGFGAEGEGTLDFADGVMTKDRKYRLVVAVNTGNSYIPGGLTHEYFLGVESGLEEIAKETDLEILSIDKTKIDGLPAIESAYSGPFEGYEQTYYIFPETPGTQYFIHVKAIESKSKKTDAIFDPLIESMTIAE